MGVIRALRAGRQTTAIQYAPIIEEFFKALPLFALLIFIPAFVQRKPVILAAVFSGIGFSVVENYFYMLQVEGGGIALIRVVLTRSLSTSIMHGLATGIIGLSLFYTARGALEEFRLLIVFPVVSYSLAVIFHALYNMYVLFGRLGRIVAVVVVLLLYATAWLFLEVYYPHLDRAETERSAQS